MKSERGGSRGTYREQGLQERVHDSYRDDAKRPDPAQCPKCGAAYLKGRWTWGEPPAGTPQHTCPACRRIADDFPAGYVTLKGRFLAEHRAEILDLVRARETREKSEHPLQRIMSVTDVAGGVAVKTTDSHIARAIAQAVHEAFKGELDLDYGKDENLLRATWSRD